ncbi:transporter substrate-binding domain-containing protein [Actinoplanes sp. NBC_00393]|uniref:transporter substrate-binding domain-containing protein n=1 Tax=Actinoplanes sp. NBC_00393 TaxID=2975953 RepID=UPI002E21E425
MRRIVAALAAVLWLLGGCGWPRDTGQTLADVRGGVLRVGVAENEPWTRTTDSGEPAGAEVALVKRLAQRLEARVEWYPGSESALMPALKDRVLDLVIGGLDAKSPWIEQASLTRPYVTMRTLVAAPAGTTVPDDLAGVRVAVQAGTAEVAVMTAEDAQVVAVPEITGKEGLPVVVGEWRVAELGLRETGHETGSADHVWAVPPGENGWQVEVERFLLSLRHEDVTALLAEAEK